MSSPIKLVVFDLGGTVVDHGCLAPVVAITEVFAAFGVAVSHEEARGPMGLHKRDHIRELLRLPGVTERWHEQHSRPSSETDVAQMYEALVPRQKEVALHYTELVPGVLDCLVWLRDNDISIAATTGYPRSVARPILAAARDQGFQVDASICADEVPAGRPAPWMIFRSMESLGIFPPTSVVKVGDTVPDMQAATNAGVWAIGVTEAGSEFGLTLKELEELAVAEREERHDCAARKLRNGGAHAVLRSLEHLPAAIDGQDLSLVRQ